MLTVARRSAHFCGLLSALCASALVGCGGGSSNPAPTDGAPSDATSDGSNPVGDASSDLGGDSVGDVASDGIGPVDGGTDAPITPIVCDAAPVVGLPMKLNHSPDALRTISTAAMTLLPDGTLLVAFVEALDETGRSGLFARVIDPTTATIGADTRLDVDADEIPANPNLAISSTGDARLLTYQNSAGQTRGRIFESGVWSTDEGLAGVNTFAPGETPSAYYAPDGRVIILKQRSSAPFLQGSVFMPGVGGAGGSFAPWATLDLDGATSGSTVQGRALPDGSFTLLIWQGPGGPAVRTLSPSGAWTTASLKAEVGGLEVPSSAVILDDGTVVLVDLETTTTDTLRALTTTYTADTSWSAARLLSKIPQPDAGPADAVLPNNGNPFLFAVDGETVEFDAWLAACTDVAANCMFEATQIRFTGGAGGGSWADPVPLGVGTETDGPANLSVTSLGAGSAIVSRRATDGSAFTSRFRFGAEAFTAAGALLDPTNLDFTTPIQSDVRYFGRGDNLWSIVSRVLPNATTGALDPQVSVLGKVDPASAATTKWGLVVADSGSGPGLEGFDVSSTYADGAGGFTLTADHATDGVSVVQLLVHASATAAAFDTIRVLGSDETSASYVSVPATPPRASLDNSAVYLVETTPTPGPGNRLYVYAWNGAPTFATKLLANESRAPRAFPTSAVSFGCGGAILYAEDPADGTHGLQLVLAQ